MPVQAASNRLPSSGPRLPMARPASTRIAMAEEWEPGSASQRPETADRSESSRGGNRNQRRTTVFRLLACALAISTFSGAAVAGENACEREMARASAAYGVPLGVLYAVGMT